MGTGQAGAELRVGWVDAAKGLCIIFVVMMHSTLGVGIAMEAEGWMHEVVAFARPFRMPDFFLISGLFLGLVIDRPWRRYLDRKVVHFLYFYVLWLTIQFAFKAPGMAAENGVGPTLFSYLEAFWEPFGTLWFIYILPLFFLFTRLVRTLPVWFVFLWAAALEIMPIHSGWLIFDEFCGRYVYFFVGYAFADSIFRLAGWARANQGPAFAYLGAWGVLNGLLVFSAAPASLSLLLQPGGSGSLAELPLISFGLGLAGAAAIVLSASLVSGRNWAGWLSWLGAHSIVIYLAFFLPMAVARVVLVRTGIIDDVGTISFLVTVAAVAGPAIFYMIIQRFGVGRFLFERPAWAYIDRPAATGRLAAAAQ